MPDLVVSNFGRGKDRRRIQVSAQAGTLWEAVNGHINAGGELEARKGLVSYLSNDLPNGTGYTFGLAQYTDLLYTFGSPAAPGGMPAEVTYQRLQHPSTGVMTALNYATLYDSHIYAIATYDDGNVYHFYDGSRITDWYDGKARGSFVVTAGTSSAGVNKVSSVKVNGVEVLNVAVDWGTSHATTAAAIAAQINTYTSTPEYAATSSGATVYIIAGTAGTASNGYSVAVTIGGDVTVGSVTSLAAGADNSPGNPGTFAITLGNKVYTVAGGTRVNFSGSGTATAFNTATAGAGFFKPSAHAAGSASIQALGGFFANLVIYAKNAIQVWHVEENDDHNAILQILRGNGTRAPRSVLGLDDEQMFLGNGSGIRSLRPRDASNSAMVVKSGSPIDVPLQDYLATLSQSDQDKCIGVLEPREERPWFIVGTRAYVLSRFPDALVYGWSEYQFSVTITDAVAIDKKLYLRAGNKVYLYGGSDFTYFDACNVEFRIPFLDAARPAGYKDLNNIDVALQGGPWTLSLSTNPNDPDTLDQVLITSVSTFADGSGASRAAGRSTHIAAKLTCTTPNGSSATTPKVSQFVLGYARDDSIPT